MMKKKKVQTVVMTRLMAAMMAVMLSVLMVLPAQAASAADYAAVFDATYYAEHYPDLKAVFGTDEAALLNHFITCGMAEGRQGNAEFNVQAYKERYEDLQAAFGDNLPAYYMHYITNGKAEGRTATAVVQTTTGQNAGNESPKAAVEHDSDYWQYFGSVVADSDVRNYWDIGMAYELLGYENMERENAGLKLLVWEDSLTIRAQLRAREIVTDYSHNSAGDYIRGCEENIAWYQQNASDTIGTWTMRNESTDRMNILHPTNRLTAIGVYIDENGVAHIAQLFTEHVQ